MPGIVYHGLRAWERALGDSADPLECLMQLFVRLGDAYPEGATRPRGHEAWRRLVSEAMGVTAVTRPPLRIISDLRDLAEQDAERAPGRTVAPRCIFVSHRQSDVGRAEDLAKEILGEGLGFDVWLDIWDPFLGIAQKLGLPRHSEAMLVGLIIEMGLVNSCAVIALMSDKAAGSAWIPYEYGRVKHGGPFAGEAAASLRGLSANAVPEYMLLGPRLRFDGASGAHPGLQGWLKRL